MLFKSKKAVIPASEARSPAGRQVGNPSWEPPERFRTNRNDSQTASLSLSRTPSGPFATQHLCLRL